MLGVVNLDKPVGPTSHDMVAFMRRLTGTRRIGHAGTLDPLASGVLPILVGAATRFSEELTGGHKRYDAVVRLGWRSATDDAEGPLKAGGLLPDPEAAAAALATFLGTFPQRPPAFSARKVAGKVAYRAARGGSPVELPPRMVTIDELRLVHVERTADALDLRIDLRCGPGTYVRSLARDLGDRLGCGGYLRELRRTEAAGLRVEDARTPATLERLASDGLLASALVSIASLLPLPRVDLDAAAAERFQHGLAVAVDDSAASAGRRAVFRNGQLVGVGTLEDGHLQPDKVLEEPAP